MQQTSEYIFKYFLCSNPAAPNHGYNLRVSNDFCAHLFKQNYRKTTPF